MNLQFLKPDDRAITQLAVREACVEHVRRFRPITAGPLVAVLVCGVAVLAALPFMAWRCATALCRRRIS